MVGILVHCSDIYIPSLERQSSLKWANLVKSEFEQQAKEEKIRGMPPTPYYQNLEVKLVLANSEKNFTEKIVRPIWLVVDRFLQGHLYSKIKNIESTLKYWQGVILEEKAKSKGAEL